MKGDPLTSLLTRSSVLLVWFLIFLSTINVVGLSYGQQGAPTACLFVFEGTFDKREEEKLSSCFRIASSENTIKPLLPFRASNGESVRNIVTKAAHVSKRGTLMRLVMTHSFMGVVWWKVNALPFILDTSELWLPPLWSPLLCFCFLFFVFLNLWLVTNNVFLIQTLLSLFFLPSLAFVFVPLYFNWSYTPVKNWEIC